MQADVLDIIFDGRNKQYGAYQLRKTYKKRLGIALGTMFGFCLLAVGGSVLASGSGTTRKAQIMVSNDINIASLEEKKPPPVVPPTPKEQPRIETRQFTPPKLVTEEVKDPPPTQEALEDTKIGAFNQEGIKSDAPAPPVEDKGTGAVETPKVTEDYDHVFVSVQQQAQFPGGPQAWQKFLERNLRQDVPVDNGAPPADYQVIVSFLVDKDGNVTDVKAENDPGYGTAAEAVKVIQHSGKWKAAMQNGRNVIFRQKQSITFRVSEN